jgi:gliding motility-associated-like protein
VRPKPGAAFSFLPNPPVENTPTQFTNLSTGASRYLWYFGDGSVSSARDTVHQYQKTDSYNASLVAYNIFGCSDTAARVVSAIVNPIVGVPSAFTPNNDGVNDVVKVRGFGIDQMMFRIYNRWGQEVFVSQNPEFGWDGRFKGALQPMDVYGYTLNILFSDGTNISRKGEITLIR